MFVVFFYLVFYINNGFFVIEWIMKVNFCGFFVIFLVWDFFVIWIYNEEFVIKF